MATTTPLAYNTGPNISGTTQIGSLAVGITSQEYSKNIGGVTWWMGPDQDLGYVIAVPVSGNTQPTPFSGVNASVGFFISEFKTEESFINLAEYIANQDNDPQTFVDGDAAITWLNANGYWTSFTPKTPYSELQIIAEYLRNYMPEFRNPSFYNYQLDGNGYFINDGGGDMYDNGNISSPWVIANTEYISNGTYDSGDYPYAVDYTNSATTTNIDTSFGYISLGYQQFTGVQSPTYLPLTVLGARDNITFGPSLPIGFQTGGNSGADGGGTLASGLIYSGSVVSGFTVYAFFRETYNAGDPSHCDLYILLGHPNWDSVFGTVNSFAQPTNVGGCGGYLYTTGAGTKNILTIKTLLSKNGGQLVTSAECQTVVDNFIKRVKESQGF
jgi:hypothetical protein